MKKDDILAKVIVELYLEKEGKILLQRRTNTNYEDGKYGFVGGHVAQNETLKEALVREVKEEAGIKVFPEELDCIFIANKTGKSNCINFIFKTNKFEGEPINMEPDKCSDLTWFDINDLPENMIKVERQVIQDGNTESITINEFKFL